LQKFLEEKSLAMDIDDLKFCQDYYKNTEKRDPTITEIKIIDTYWSDHCRHTTFNTELTSIEIKDEKVNKAYDRYLSMRSNAGDTKPVTLLDMA
ncbi:MAG: phosphoribosylformylglycinamidine synthase, partial [Oscillospiraceae bacterium]